MVDDECVIFIFFVLSHGDKLNISLHCYESLYQYGAVCRLPSKNCQYFSNTDRVIWKF